MSLQLVLNVTPGDQAVLVAHRTIVEYCRCTEFVFPVF